MLGNLSWRDVRDGNLRVDEVIEALGLDVKQIGDELNCPCPLPTHTGDGDPNFNINVETFKWHCWSCNEGGALPRLIQLLLGISKDDAIRWLCQFSDAEGNNGSVENWINRLHNNMRRTIPAPMQRTPVMPWLPTSLVEKYQENLDAPAANWASIKWGVSIQTIQEFGLGYDPNYSHKGIWVGPAIIIPNFWGKNLVGWQARWTETPKGPPKYPKYVNTDEFPKQFTLYNWDRVLQRNKFKPTNLLVVESFGSVMKLHEVGLSAVATFGASVSARQIQLLSSYPGSLYVAGDSDTVGQQFSHDLAKNLHVHRPVFLVPPSPGEKTSIGDLSKNDILGLVDRAVPFHRASI